jgi:hypothetical protein
MALTITQIGNQISTEKLTFQAVSDDPLTTSVRMAIIFDPLGLEEAHVLEHLPDFGTTDTFTFEVNSIMKDYFDFQFQPLEGVNTSVIDNVIFGLGFNEVFDNIVQGASFRTGSVTYNMTQDTFEIEDFDLTDYDCGDSGSLNSKLLTSAPNPLPIGDNTSLHISCLTSSYTGTTPKQEWVIETYLNNVLVLATTEDVNVPQRGIDLTYLADGNYDIAVYRFDFNSADGYDEVRIYIRDIASPFTVRSETRAYKLRKDCEKTITLSWYNELGAQDSYTLAGNITRVGKYQDSTYRKVRPVNPSSTDVGDLVYNSSYNYQYDIFSDRMPEKSVQWLSKMLINRRAAIQIEGLYGDGSKYLYNFFTINNGVEGDGRVSGGIVNNNLSGWVVPTVSEFQTLSTFLGGDLVSGGKMKEAGFENWSAPNTGATNESGFTALPNGNRTDAGLFIGTGFSWSCWASDVDVNNSVSLGGFDADLVFSLLDNKNGNSIRLVRPATGSETNGQVLEGAYKGNNGYFYDGVVIGTQVWILEDLKETKYNDGSDISIVEDSGAWGLLATGGVCTYENETVVTTLQQPKYFPIVIETEESTLEDKFAPSTLFRVKFRLANRRKGLK